MKEHKTAVVEALRLADKPLSKEQALSIAVHALSASKGPVNDFRKWFEIHGDYLTERINGEV